MKKEELPQDLSALGKITGEVCYVVDESGNYTTQLSNGWEVKSSALEVAWKDVEQRIQDAHRKSSEQRSQSHLIFYGTARDGYSYRGGIYRILEMAGKKTFEI